MSSPAKLSMLVVSDSLEWISSVRESRPSWSVVSSSDKVSAVELSPKSQIVLIDVSSPWATDDLFREIAARAPGVLRVAAVPEMEVWRAVRTSSVAHQVVSARSDVGIVMDVCERSLSMSGVLSNPALLDVISMNPSLSAPPEIWHRLSEVLANPNSGATEVASAVATDSAITAQVMRMANSAFFGLSRQVERLEDAVSLLGLTLIRAIVLEAEVSMSFVPTLPGFDRKLVQHHAAGVANISRHIAGRSAAADAFLAGFLVDIGLTLLASSAPSQMTALVEASERESSPLHTVEREILGFTHGELGACLLGLWGLPMTVIEAVALHHERPDFKGLMSVREVVYIARDAANSSLFYDPYDSRGPLITDVDVLADVTVGPIIDKAHLVASEER